MCYMVQHKKGKLCYPLNLWQPFWTDDLVIFSLQYISNCHKYCKLFVLNKILVQKMTLTTRLALCELLSTSWMETKRPCSGVSSGGGEIRETKKTSDSQVPQGSGLLC